MTVAVLYALAVLVSVMVAGFAGVTKALPAYHSWQHGRCLVRTAVLERELGIEVTNPELLPRPSTSPEVAAQRWANATARAAENYRSAASGFSDGFQRMPRKAVARLPKAQRRSDDYRPYWRRY